MRPIKLEMEGFTSFRDKTEVDFEDADLFVLTGPTGAGKSSVIDAIAFALYGSIPRLGSQAVAPVISRGMLQARVRLDFAVGEETYTAVRVARATKAGATTREATLEDAAGNTLVRGKEELDEEIKKLLGLTFDHFTKSVVLPQGDFADLLHETAGERQKMLRKLLGAELFSRLAQLAGKRKTTSKALADNLERDIEQLEDEGITEDGLKAARQRGEDIDSLVKRIEGRQPEIECLQEKMRSVKQESASVGARISLLSAIRIPEGVPELAEKIADGSRGLDDAKEAHGGAMEERQRRQDDLDDLPREANLRLYLSRYDDLVKARKEQHEAASDLEEARTSLEAVKAEAQQAEKAADVAEQAKRSMEDEHKAYHLAAGLVMGGSCPVCRQDVSEPPELDAPEEMEKVETELLTAQQGLDRAVKKLKDARSAVDRQEQSLKDSDSRVKDLERELEEAPTREVVEAALEQVKAAVEALQKANGKEKEASDRLAETQKVVNALEGDEKRAWQNYDTQRDLLAEMGSVLI